MRRQQIRSGNSYTDGKGNVRKVISCSLYTVLFKQVKSVNSKLKAGAKWTSQISSFSRWAKGEVEGKTEDTAPAVKRTGKKKLPNGIPPDLDRCIRAGGIFGERPKFTGHYEIVGAHTHGKILAYKVKLFHSEEYQQIVDVFMDGFPVPERVEKMLPEAEVISRQVFRKVRKMVDHMQGIKHNNP